MIFSYYLCHRFHCRFCYLRRFRRFIRCHFRRHRNATFYDLIDDFVNTFELIDNNDANEKTKSSNNHFHQRLHAVNLIYNKTQTQTDRHVLIQ